MANDQTGAQNSVGGGERNGGGVLAAADRRRHGFCPAGRLRLDDTHVGHDLAAKPEELCPKTTMKWRIHREEKMF